METSRLMLSAVMEAAGAREGVLFLFSDKPDMLSSASALGFALMPDPAFIPLLPKHVHALVAARGPVVLNSSTYSVFLSSNGNVAPDSLSVWHRSRPADGSPVWLLSAAVPATLSTKTAKWMRWNCYAHVHRSRRTESCANANHRAARFRKSKTDGFAPHGFYDNALEAFATAIDVKHVNIHGHSLRVGRYAARPSAMPWGWNPSEVAALRSAGYLHDIGKVAVDRRLFGKPGALDPEEFREMADHTTVGHEIVSTVQFPWPRIPETVRWHHERADGSGYPDRLMQDDVPMAVRIVGVADSFDAMTSTRPYRAPLSVGSALSDLVRLAPEKFDPNVVQALLIQVRRDVVGSSRSPLLDSMSVNIAAADIDHLAATLQYKVSRGKAYLTP